MTESPALWQPSCSLDTLRLKAQLIKRLREHFDNSGATEVFTPVLSQATIPDPAVRSLVSFDDVGDAASIRYLQTSPEFAMKRLLAAGSGDIYQICPVFRSGEAGRRHNPEFHMLEWYRVGVDHWALMQEIESLLLQVFEAFGRALTGARYLSYGEAIETCLQVDPDALTIEGIKRLLQERSVALPDMPDANRDAWLDLLMSTCVFEQFDDNCLTFLHSYPASQSALARLELNSDGQVVASRFEVFVGALELGNGFHELADADEQRQRFEDELVQRQRAGLPGVPLDKRLLAALKAGLPDCAGVAIGLERLLMVLTGSGSIGAVMAFDDARA